MKYLLPIFLLSTFTAIGQNLINGDLEGTIGFIITPPGWQNIPYTDVSCEATNSGWDSPDVLDINGPSSSTGIFGSPYSGITFVSGMYGSSAGAIWQEGISQVVTGFSPNSTYLISLYQSVVKFNNALDQSGCWIVIIDNTPVDTTTLSYSALVYNDPNLIWEKRQVIFTATQSSHTIKFLPLDNDTNTTFSMTDTTGALRMGLDSITLSGATNTAEVINFDKTVICPNPTDNWITLSLKEDSKASRVTVYNIQGQEVLLDNIASYTGKLQLSLGHLPSGLYLVQVVTDGGVITKKIIKE